MGELGVATTMFFHANATIRHRGNLITHLEEREGSILTARKDKELLLRESFKERLGQTDFRGFALDPTEILERREDLGFLEEPFLTSEIDPVIKNLLNDKPLEPDGFNNGFLKVCWATIKEDFLQTMQ
jgi:hypothetical protein